MSQNLQDFQNPQAFKQIIIDLFTNYLKRKIADELDEIEKLGGLQNQ